MWNCSKWKSVRYITTTTKIMKKETKLEQILLDNILYIGEEIPELLAKDKRPKFVVLGTPQEIINETKSNIKYYLYGLNKSTFVFIF